ncbi:MAG: hypothetical protein VB013_04320 [Anaerolineaceae bacterium]|nr:hypothetical protein [Anaerolineaceae bacterium]
MNSELLKILKPTYAPCIGFSGICKEMVWNPRGGNIPRGYYGALGELKEVELVLVFAEPGNPYPDENYSNIESVFNYVGRMFRESTDPFHENIRTILSSCWPDLSIEDQFRKVWMTNSVLCSAKTETGRIPASITRFCGNRYLSAQLKLFPKALVVAMGKKARERLESIGSTNYIEVSSPARPEGKKPKAKESWKRIPEELHRRAQNI